MHALSTADINQNMDKSAIFITWYALPAPFAAG